MTPPDVPEKTEGAYSVNERAEKLMGRRPSGIPIDCPCELGYWCPMCRKEWDEALSWSEYSGFLWCPTCNFDWPSALCVRIDSAPDPKREWWNGGRDAAVKVFLDTVENSVARLRERVARMAATLEKIATWLDDLAVTADKQAENKSFPSYSEACAADAQNYRATAKAARAALRETEAKEGKDG